MKKILYIALLLVSQHGFAQQEANDVQIKYALQQFGKNLKMHHVKNILDALDPSFRIAEYNDKDVYSIVPQLVNPVILDTVYYEAIVKKNGKIYAKQVAVPTSGPKMVSWLRMSKFLTFERIGHFEQLMGYVDPVFQELQPVKLLSKVNIKRASGLMFVDVAIAGKKYNFLFDSGAGATTINENLAASLNLKINQKAVDIKTAGKGGQFKTIDSLALNIEGVNIRGKQVVVADLNSLSKVVGLPMDGIIGFDLLKDYQVAVDLDDSQMNIYNFGYFDQSTGTKIPVKLSGNTAKLEVNLKVNNINYPSTLLFDTGNGGSISGNYFLNTYANGLVDKLKNKRSSSSMDLTNQVSKAQIGGIDEIDIAGYSLKHPVVTVDLPKEQNPYGFNSHGLLGMTLIGRFNMCFNYNLNYIQLSPNKTFSTPLVPLYALGLGFQKDGDKFIVRNADVDGWAYQAGLRKGDELLRINNVVPESVDQITQQLRTLAKNKVPLEVNRNQQKIKIELKKFEI
ncbi:retroviral-like aspartic protease family protein [Pedobacter psychrodurus]|uniref:retroviral-like aspartic protease family protein n=1 Tax=Pedobacter psychrodurus TaxID=2530456 RepID=UPI0029316840|nr:aspartyl protease family protein [Pedobacter psychrodurus]